MATGLVSVALGLAMQVGAPAPTEAPNFPPLQNAFSQHGFEGQYEQRYPFDSQQNWVHGYFQEIPAYGGHVFYRPYNYKDVLSQSQTAAGWGLSPTMPYSQQFWHRYHDQATMLKLSRTDAAPARPAAPSPGAPYQTVSPAAAWSQPVAPPTFQPAYWNTAAATAAPQAYSAPPNYAGALYSAPPVMSAPPNVGYAAPVMYAPPNVGAPVTAAPPVYSAPLPGYAPPANYAVPQTAPPAGYFVPGPTFAPAVDPGAYAPR